MSLFSGFPATELGIPLNVNEENPTLSLGQMIYGDDGRKFVYAKAGAVALVAGQVQQSAAEDTGDQNIAATTTAVGATSITTASMTVTKNQYAGGYVGVTVTPGLARYYRIKSHQAYTSAAATFLLEDAIEVALTSTSRLDFIPNPYNGVVVNPTSDSSSVAGVAIAPITIGYYGFLQVAGPAVVTNDAAGALTVGVTVMPSTSVAGSVRLATAGNPVIGQAMTGIASGESGFINLAIR